MKFLKPDEAMVRYLKETAGCTENGLYQSWETTRKPVILVFAGVALLYANLVIAKHTDDMYAFFHLESKWLTLLCWGLFTVAFFIAETAFHELLHVIVLPHKLKEVTVVLDLPHTVSIRNGAWETKTESLVSLIAPVIGVTLLAVLPTYLSGHPVLAGFFMLINVGGSSSDIYAFFYLLVHLPKDALSYGNRYKTAGLSDAALTDAVGAADQRARLFYGEYADGREENRLFASKADETEYLVTLRYLRKYLRPGARVIDIGAGAGAYTKALAAEGCFVDALDLHPVNVEIMRDALQDTENVRVFQADARDLSGFEADAYDLALLLGPVYHLHDREDRMKAIREAARRVKSGAPVFVAFCLRDAPLVENVFQCVDPAAMLTGMGYDRETAAFDGSFGSSVKLETLPAVLELTERVCRELPLDRGPLFAQDGPSHVLRENVNHMSEESYQAWIDYLTATAERTDLMGCSNHIVQVFVKR